MTAGLIAFGSNQGQSNRLLQDAVERIDRLPATRICQVGDPVVTQPIGSNAGGRYLNAALLIESTQDPIGLMEQLLAIEVELGRVRTVRWGPRTIDLDLLLLGDHVIASDRLTLPHPRMTFRRFVLQPSAEIAPQLVHPLSGLTIAELLACLEQRPDRVGVVADPQIWNLPGMASTWHHLRQEGGAWQLERLDSTNDLASHPGRWKLVVTMLDANRSHCNRQDVEQVQQSTDTNVNADAAIRFRGATLVIPGEPQVLHRELVAAMDAIGPIAP